MNTSNTNQQKHIINLGNNCLPEKMKNARWGGMDRMYKKWSVITPIGEGLLSLDVTKLRLYLLPDQTSMSGLPGPVTGWRLKEYKIPVLNACVLEYLLLHPELIPDSWKFNENGEPNTIIFWGTTYWHHQENMEYVPYLFWDDDAWSWGVFSLGYNLNPFYDHCPAAVLDP